MEINIKTIDGSLLKYETEGACAFDFKAEEDVLIKHMENKLVETGVVIETPEKIALFILPRSSTFDKKGLILVNSVGLIDNDYKGNEDTIKFNYLNLTGEDVFVKRGERIGQGIFLPFIKAKFKIKEEMDSKNRGSFGTTGLR